MDLMPILIILAFAGFVIYEHYQRIGTVSYADELIREHYRNKGQQVLSISKLKISEKIKYGVPISPVIRLYVSPFSFLSGSKGSVCRSVETVGDSGKEYICYVEVSFTGRDATSINEFDCYEF